MERGISCRAGPLPPNEAHTSSCKSKSVWVVTDRQGSVRANSNGEQMSYFPYGEERTSTANDREKYGTYTRDGIGQDYADQRYYNSNNGAFWNSDPGGLSTVNPGNPSSWNRFAYTNGDPINFFDPVGKDSCGADDDSCADDDCGDGESPCAADGADQGGGDCPVDTCVTVTASVDPAPTEPSTIYDLGITISVISQPASQAGQTLVGAAGSAQCVSAPVTLGMPSSAPQGGRPRTVNEPGPVITSQPLNSPYGRLWAAVQALNSFIAGIAGTDGSLGVVFIDPTPILTLRGAGPSTRATNWQ
jgi:RHS repeat-associated protein